MSLVNHLEQFMSKGKYYFTTVELKQSLKINQSSLSVSLSRLAKKGRLKMIRRGFGVIYPTLGNEPHPSFYLDGMMNYLGVKYYVGLLSAAAYWGASHQSNMSYQVVVDKFMADISLNKSKIEFITKKGTFPKYFITRIAGVGGYYNISTSELTAFDLIRFPKRSGHLNNIATVLETLSKKWDGRKIKSLCNDPVIPAVTLQRLGYLLDFLDLQKESKYFERALSNRNSASLFLSNSEKGMKRSHYELNERWNLYINTIVEPD
jgi:predicted transcriptional regulator of viral defense system